MCHGVVDTNRIPAEVTRHEVEGSMNFSKSKYGRFPERGCSLTSVVLFLLLAFACTEEPPPAAPPVDALEITSYTQPTNVSFISHLQLDWTANLQSLDDSIIIEAVNYESPGGARQLAVRPGRLGSLNITVEAIGFTAFRFRLRTRLSGIIRETAVIRVTDQQRDVWFISPDRERSVSENERYHIRWSSFGLGAGESLTLSIRGGKSDPWDFIATFPDSLREYELVIASLGRTTFELKLATDENDVVAISPRLRVLTAAGDAPIVVLSPLPGDTLVYSRDLFRWLPAPGNTAEITGIKITYDNQSQNGFGRGILPATSGEYSLFEILRDPPSNTGYRCQYTFHVQALPDTHSVTVGPFYIFDFRILTDLENAVLKRGTVARIRSNKTEFEEKRNSKNLAAPLYKAPVSYLLSADGGITWQEDNTFAGDYQTMLLSHPAAENCYLRMRGIRGTRVFEDTTGPFSIVDYTEPLFEWNVGDQFRYVLHNYYQLIDTIEVSFVNKVEGPNLIKYVIDERSFSTNKTVRDSITEYKSEMHRLEGWRIPPIDIYRFADRDLDSHEQMWYYPVNLNIKATVRKNLGIESTFERYWPPGGREEIYTMTLIQ